MNFNRILTAGFAMLAATAGAVHVEETMTLTNGWNAIYLESTPEHYTCTDFFNDMPGVLNVGAYISDAYDDTAQYTSDGQELNQKPVSYRVWQRGYNAASPLKNLAGGTSYLIFTTNSYTKTFLGIPKAPNMVWRVATGKEGYLNIAAPSLAAGTTVNASAYFKEGPFGSAVSAWQIYGTNSAPSMMPLGLMARGRQTMQAGMAYAMTANQACEWPGVIGVSTTTLFADGVLFEAGETQASIKIKNCGTTNHTFRLTVGTSAKDSDISIISNLTRKIEGGALAADTWEPVAEAWEMALAGETSETVTFGLDLEGINDTNLTYGAILTVEDLGGTGMRVRVPIQALAQAKSENVRENAEYPIGLWAGTMKLQQVSVGDSKEPVKAGGSIEPTVLLHVDKDGKAKLLQQVSFAKDTNGVARLFADLADAKEISAAARRVSSFLLDLANRQVEGSGSGFGKRLDFTWAIDAMADDNPFRHAWHPDHDGLNATYDGYSQSEVWSITNSVSLTWQDANGKNYYETKPDGISIGVVDMKIEGLKYDPIYIRGAFSMERVLANGEVE